MQAMPKRGAAARPFRLEPTPRQCNYFARAAGTARRAWNRALAEWQRQIAAGLLPNAVALKKQFNAIKYGHPDWLATGARAARTALSVASPAAGGEVTPVRYEHGRQDGSGQEEDLAHFCAHF